MYPGFSQLGTMSFQHAFTQRVKQNDVFGANFAAPASGVTQLTLNYSGALNGRPVARINIFGN
jgi:hypothetical protein